MQLAPKLSGAKHDRTDWMICRNPQGDFQQTPSCKRLQVQGKAHSRMKVWQQHGSLQDLACLHDRMYSKHHFQAVRLRAATPPRKIKHSQQGAKIGTDDAEDADHGCPRLVSTGRCCCDGEVAHRCSQPQMDSQVASTGVSWANLQCTCTPHPVNLTVSMQFDTICSVFDAR